MRLYDPTEGEILIDGINIKEYSKESIYKKIGVIFQDYIKYPLDVQANIGIGFVEEIENWNRMLRASEKSKADIFISQLPQKYQYNVLSPRTFFQNIYVTFLICTQNCGFCLTLFFYYSAM